MNKILKRLEIIKNSIVIEDDETIQLQLSRLYELDIDNDVKYILILIQNTDFEKVIPLIDAYVKQFTSLIVYENEEIQGLKLELKLLEKQFLLVSCRVEEYHNIVNDFNAKYHLQLGELIEEVLVLREEFYEFMYQNSQEGEYEYEYYEAIKDYKNFHEEFKNQFYDTPSEISKKEKKELKRLYKKASKLCHPDIIEEKKREKAEDIFKSLNAAYHQKNLRKVSEILEQLLTGESFSISSDSVFDKRLLKRKINATREKIQSIKLELESIKQNETFILVNKINDMDEYFKEKEEELIVEKENILEQMKQYMQTI
ncbi:hypothetical protein DZA35_01615 [Arcobacter sp. HD9-500m-PIT-SAG03]|nr:hypothetical protein DZA35_01615 [Arcobacter sp. HD9-500m-PIT-SAG03]